MDKIYFIENTVDEMRSKVSGYFKSYEDAYEGLKECADWWREKGTGKIYEVTFGLHQQRKLVYDSYKQGPAK